MEIDRIKNRVRKLMALANDGGASNGEIENAMRFAAKLMDEHNLAPDDVAEPLADDMPQMGRTFATTTKSRLATWESTLGGAVAELFGSVKWYRTRETAPIRVDGIAQLDKAGNNSVGTKVCFYGPAPDAAEAADLFQEWSRLIATMGVIRWAGAYAGNGGAYCYGFATALYDVAKKINRDRHQLQAKPIKQVGGPATGAITLAFRNTIMHREAKKWLELECKVFLTKSSSSGGYSGAGGSAYSQGQADGSAASFGRKIRARALLN